MEKVRLRIVGMSYSHSQQGAYALILGEEDGVRRLPIIIGGFEAQAIALEIENMKPSRPLTHDLFKHLSESFDISVDEVIIDKFVEGIFHAKILCHDLNGKHRVIDSRTSDAIAIALRFDCPFYAYESVIQEAGIEIEDEDIERSEELFEREEKKPDDVLEAKSLDELKMMLEEAVESENYEWASCIRNEINKRK
ncbi:MAG: hypothetical protein CSA95_04705 [Bacteroidetes bacterium]|nr:MAG: hypothetical protein CSA95_04705 [Bacteroidota bacterium]PIE88467.1 MAG: hypothetical protein CSA04_01775 [Bacteroidota bacterium]